MMRAALALLVGLLLVFQIVRTAMVASFAEDQPARAATLWPAHPDVIFSAGLRKAGDLALAGKPVDRRIVRPMLEAAVKAPLAPEPFLVRGVEAQLRGDLTGAARSFQEARRRDPRSIAAHYFLADLYLKTGQTREGLEEISSLARLIPQSRSQIAPYLAAYARNPRSAGEVRRLLRRHTAMQPELFNQLATDASNADLILYLWDGKAASDHRPWQEKLVTSLVGGGRYRRAHRLWARFASQPVRPALLTDPGFGLRNLPPPFGWTLLSDSGGLAEPDGRGGLRLLHYGRDDRTLASQTLLLPAGRYRLGMRINGQSPASSSLAWRVSCLPARKPILTLGLGPGRGGDSRAASFVVPPSGCGAQQLQLIATAPEFPEQAELSIGDLRIDREGGR
ncbi:MAG TPA: tetratricopeptide repeat protein [Sphingomicrobium sp.]|nr:tetratricopeptide repeat protein [Sphingomicrobium sp.]